MELSNERKIMVVLGIEGILLPSWEEIISIYDYN